MLLDITWANKQSITFGHFYNTIASYITMEITFFYAIHFLEYAKNAPRISVLLLTQVETLLVITSTRASWPSNHQIKLI